MLSDSQREIVVATWCLSAFDVDRAVSREAFRSWSRCIRWTSSSEGSGIQDQGVLALEADGLSDALSELLCQALLNPETLHTSVFPPTPQIELPQQHGKRVVGAAASRTSSIHKDEDTPRRSEAEEENEEDRDARLRVSSIGALKWLIGTLRCARFRTGPQLKQSAEYCKTDISRTEYISAIVQRIISEMHSFSVISHSPHPSIDDDLNAISGYNQPLVRRFGWSLLGTITPHIKEGESPRSRSLPYSCL